MAVIPVGAALLHLELIQVIATGGDTVKTHARHAVHIGRQQQAVPMD